MLVYAFFFLLARLLLLGMGCARRHATTKDIPHQICVDSNNIYDSLVLEPLFLILDWDEKGTKDRQEDLQTTGECFSHIECRTQRTNARTPCRCPHLCPPELSRINASIDMSERCGESYAISTKSHKRFMPFQALILAATLRPDTGSLITHTCNRVPRGITSCETVRPDRAMEP
jgi:hypothetical protein